MAWNKTSFSYFLRRLRRAIYSLDTTVGGQETMDDLNFSSQPELFFTFFDTSDTVCPTPWNMMGTLISEAAGLQQSRKSDDDQRETATMH